jgi:hypothetical protein
LADDEGAVPLRTVVTAAQERYSSHAFKGSSKPLSDC